MARTINLKVLAHPRADPSLGHLPWLLPVPGTPGQAPPGRAGCEGSPAALGGAHLLVDVAHSQVLLVAGARHSNVLQPVPGPALAAVAAEFLSAQGIGDLRDNGTQMGSAGAGWQQRRGEREKKGLQDVTPKKK